MERVQKGLVIETAWDMSINDLLVEQAVGHSVLRTPHVGNVAVHNMALFDAGIPGWLVDYGAADRDPNYRTETVVQGGTVTDIAQANGRLACRTNISRDEETWLDEYHLAALTGVLPGAQVETYSAYLRRRESVAAELFDIVAGEFPDSFKHEVTRYGLRVDNPSAAEQIERIGIMQLKDDHREGEAVLPSTMLNLLATFVIEALENQDDVQYHVSGSQFFQYVYKDGMDEQLDRMYQAVRAKASFGTKLPQALRITIVPARAAVLATTQQRRDNLDALITATDEYAAEAESLEAERRLVFATGDTDDSRREAFVRHVKERRTSMHDGLLEVLCDQPEIVADRAKDTFVTQYDVLEEGGLYVAERNNSLTMRELTALHKLLKGAAASRSGRAKFESSLAAAR